MLAKGESAQGLGLSMKIGHVATPRMTMIIEVRASANPPDPTKPTSVESTAVNLLVGTQYWLGPSIWASLGFGIGHYTRAAMEDETNENVRLFGPAGGVGVGVEVARFPHIALEVAVFSATTLTRDGPTLSNLLAFGMSLD